MTDETKIEWTDFTVNFWEGCQKVGPGCDHCYAEARDVRFTGGSHWGPGAPRRKVKGGIPKLRKINRDAEKFHDENGHWPRVFCSSLSDVFDNAVDPEWRREAFTAITVAPRVRIQLLTKRVGNVEKMIPDIWKSNGWPHWVGLMITVVNQAEADRDIPKLLDLKARFGIPWVGLSMEPLLGLVDLSDRCNGWYFANWLAGTKWHDTPGLSTHKRGEPHIDWVICGGESGRNARPMHPDWARSLRDQCQAAGTKFFFKQWGEWYPVNRAELGPYGEWIGGGKKPLIENIEGTSECGYYCSEEHGHVDHKNALVKRVGKKAAGRLLDGREWNEVPE